MTAPRIPVTGAAAVRVLVTGGRDFTDRNLVWRTLDGLARERFGHDDQAYKLCVIHGACPTGADHHAHLWAENVWAGILAYPADWKAHGRVAGPLRNARMIVEGRPHLVIAFPGGQGTADMVRKARAACIPVREISRG